MQEKLMDLREAISRFVKDGDTVAIGGCGRNRSPMALIREVIRQNKKDLRIVGREKGMDFDILIGANCVKENENRIYSSWYRIKRGSREYGVRFNNSRKSEGNRTTYERRSKVH
ncbi:MAG: CoA-transferase [Campylobacterota bacterium]|nr:CoA-transferase [Campylobacterota bacterium]